MKHIFILLIAITTAVPALAETKASSYGIEHPQETNFTGSDYHVEPASEHQALNQAQQDIVKLQHQTRNHMIHLNMTLKSLQKNQKSVAD